MPKYIERDALEVALNHRLNFLMAENGEYDHYTSGFDEAVTRVENFPASDVAPVIFCKYCKHFHAVIIDEKTGELGDWGICDQPWRNEGYDVNETDYCSYADPK